MKALNKILLSIIVSLAIGLLLGYMIFGNVSGQVDSASSTGPDMHGNQSEKEEIWTCSMHPQIRQNGPGLCPICGMDLIPLKSASGSDPIVLEMTKDAVKLADIQTTVVEKVRGIEEKTIPLSGKVKADERLASSQVAHIPGRIEKLYVSFTGEQVNAGDRLASIYSPELITAQRELQEAKKMEEVNPRLIEAARQKLRYWKIGEDNIRSMEEAGKIREQFVLYADSKGTVLKRNVSIGDYVKQGESLFELIDLTKVWVLFDAYEDDLDKIRIGNRIEFTTPAYPEKTFSGVLSFIDPVIDPVSRVSKLRIEINNQSGKLKPEMLVYGQLRSGNSPSTKLSIPKSAVMWTGKRSVVYVKKPDTEIPSFEFREVEIMPTGGEQYLVLNGLEAGEEVVTKGSFVIDASAQLNNQASMMNRNVQIKNSTGKSSSASSFGAAIPLDFRKQISSLAQAYLKIKDALVQSDSELARVATKSFEMEVKNVDMTLLSGYPHSFWMKQQEKFLNYSNKLNGETEIDAQRLSFDKLSVEMIKAVQAFGIEDMELYIQHCPMAIDEDGADWISSQKEIFNPYFGSKMLKCGYTTDSLK